uniref:Putative capsid protein n=1 Tax=viral metagenome TaxID=1070528 RepID=A0A6M3JPA7_9ZZZZ
MAVTLADHAMQAANEGKLILSEIAYWGLEESNILQNIMWATNPQLSMQVTAAKTLPTTGTRKINASFSESSGKFEQKIESKYIFGLNIDVDPVLEKANPGERQTQRLMAAKSMAYKFNEMFINGDPADDEFKGLKMRVDDIYAAGFTDQYIDGGSGTTGRGVLYDTTEQHYFMDRVSELISSVVGGGPDALYMNRKMYLAFESAVRRTGLMKQTEDMFGRIINMWGGVPLIDIGRDDYQSTTEIITNGESLSGGTDETSIYAVKYGENQFLWGMQQDAMEVTDVGLTDDGMLRDRVEWVIGLAHSQPLSISRAYGFVADAGAS